jgi:hypothetical protein
MPAFDPSTPLNAWLTCHAAERSQLLGYCTVKVDPSRRWSAFSDMEMREAIRVAAKNASDKASDNGVAVGSFMLHNVA